jgi:hypothetical protein
MSQRASFGHRMSCALIALPILLIALLGSGDWLALANARRSRPNTQ